MDETNANPTQPSVQNSQITTDQTPAEAGSNTIPQPNTPTPTPVVTEPPKPKGNNLLLIVLSILILGIIAGGAYLYLQNQKPEIPVALPVNQQSPSPTPDPMADWEIYSVSPYQVKYPQGLHVREDEGSVLNISKWGPTQTEGTELFDGFSITFQPREISDADLSAYVDAKIEEVKIQDISKVTSGPSPVTLNNYEGLTFVEEGLGIYKVTIVESKEKSMFMEISVLVSDPGNLGFQETVDQILSTFEFIENIPTPVITKLNDDWNSYKTEAMNILFEYPATYETIEERIDYLAIYSPPIPNRPTKVTSVVDGELKIEIYVSDAKIPDSSEQCWYDHNSATSVLDQEITTVGGVKGILYTWEGVGTGQSICLIKDNKRYSIVKYPANTSRQDEYEHFLSTFRFYSEL